MGYSRIILILFTYKTLLMQYDSRPVASGGAGGQFLSRTAGGRVKMW